MAALRFTQRIAIALAVMAGMITPAFAQTPAERPVDFVSQIKPILTARCINCHHSEALFGNLNLENRKRAFAKRPQGPVIVPREPAKSPLYVVLTLPPKKTQKAMPPTGHRIEKEQVELIRLWIEQGADWPNGKPGVIKPLVTQKPPGT